MTNLEILLLIIIWVAYGVFNANQHDCWKTKKEDEIGRGVGVIILAPLALIIRIFRGIFIWKGEY
jgi:hypothetical protein